MVFTVQEVVDKLEREMMMGKGRWVADFNESFRDFRLGTTVFDVALQGNTRVRGFLLSRLFSFMLNPNYNVGCFILSSNKVRRLDTALVKNVVQLIKGWMMEKGVRWSWLFLIMQKADGSLKRFVKEVPEEAIGVILADVEAREILHNNTFLGKQGRKYIKL